MSTHPTPSVVATPVPRSGNSTAKHVGLGLGGAVENSYQNAPLALANPIYNVGLGVSPVLIGVAMAIPRIWDGHVQSLTQAQLTADWATGYSNISN